MQGKIADRPDFWGWGLKPMRCATQVEYSPKTDPRRSVREPGVCRLVASSGAAPPLNLLTRVHYGYCCWPAFCMVKWGVWFIHPLLFLLSSCSFLKFNFESYFLWLNLLKLFLIYKFLLFQTYIPPIKRCVSECKENQWKAKHGSVYLQSHHWDWSRRMFRASLRDIS